MKALSKKHRQMADEAVALLHRLQDLGVEIISVEGDGLTFWRPTTEERIMAYDIVSHPSNKQYNEFKQKSYEPSTSFGLRIDAICP